MKNATQCEKQLGSLIRKLPEAAEPVFPDADDLVATLVQSFLMWEATTERAMTAYERLRASIVDFNDLRVSMPEEISEYLGSRYPAASERCRRMRSALRAIYLREHAVSLDTLRTAGKRDVRKYFESIEGMVPYVSARVMLLGFDTHAIPVDEQLRERLAEAGAADADSPIAEVAAWLTRQVKAGEGRRAHLRLQAWVDSGPGRAPRGSAKSAPRRRGSGRASGNTSSTA